MLKNIIAIVIFFLHIIDFKVKLSEVVCHSFNFV